MRNIWKQSNEAKNNPFKPIQERHKIARRRNLPEEELNEIVLKLANDVSLSAKNKDHALQGEFVGCRECHIRPDWLLIYRKTDNNELQILELVRTGTHSDLFKK